jgi:hypothetical protein
MGSFSTVLGSSTLLRGYGRFSLADLEALIWWGYTPEEQKVFLGMMESCGICFRLRKLPRDHTESDEKEEAEWEYSAPELLPKWSDAQELLLDGCAMILRTRSRRRTMPFFTKASCAVIFPNLGTKLKTRLFTVMCAEVDPAEPDEQDQDRKYGDCGPPWKIGPRYPGKQVSQKSIGDERSHGVPAGKTPARRRHPGIRKLETKTPEDVF